MMQEYCILGWESRMAGSDWRWASWRHYPAFQQKQKQEGDFT